MMRILRTARSLLDLGIDAVEGLLYAVFDFDRQADELWDWTNRLADKEAEEEVTEPAWTDPGDDDVVETRLEKAGRDAYRKYFTGFATTSSVADPSPEATDEQPPRSAPNHGVERGGLQLTGISRTDVLSAVAALRAVGDQRGPENRDYWNSVADRFDAVYAEM